MDLRAVIIAPSLNHNWIMFYFLWDNFYRITLAYIHVVVAFVAGKW